MAPPLLALAGAVIAGQLDAGPVKSAADGYAELAFGFCATSAGAAENDKLKQLWCTELGALGAKSGARNSQGERLSIAKSRSENSKTAAVKAAFNELFASLLMVTILAD